MRKWNCCWALQNFHEEVVDLLGHSLANFIFEVFVHGLFANESVGVFGTPPMKIIATCTPVASFPLADDSVHPTIAVGVVFKAQW